MRAAVFEGPGNIRVHDVPDPQLELDSDAIVRVTDAAISGTSLWAYRGYSAREPGSRIGQEFVGVVEEVGTDVRTVRKGDLVVSPPTWSCGHCEFCRSGLQTSCVEGGYYSEPGHDGGLGEFVRVPYADGTLVVAPGSMLGAEKRLLPLTSVLATGHHAAVSAGVGHRSTVAVIGDGAVGICAVVAARRLGAERVIAVGHHEDRLALAEALGATETVQADGDEVVEKIMTVTGGVDAVLECVGAQKAIDTAVSVVLDGGTVGYVGVPHATKGLSLARLYSRNITIRGGIAPVRAYLPELLADVVDGILDVTPVLDLTVGLEEIADGFAMMDDRLAIKTHVQP